MDLSTSANATFAKPTSALSTPTAIKLSLFIPCHLRARPEDLAHVMDADPRISCEDDKRGCEDDKIRSEDNKFSACHLRARPEDLAHVMDADPRISCEDDKKRCEDDKKESLI